MVYFCHLNCEYCEEVYGTARSLYWHLRKHHGFNHDDAFASNPARLQESRDLVLRMADWIVPGHAGIYKNDKTGAAAKVKPASAGRKKVPKIVVVCKKCHREMEQKDKCQCRPYLCFKCCECGLDCDNCNCSHKR